MVDLASMLFGDFQESIVATFGETIGWVVGHGLIVGLIALIWYTWVGREHIRTPVSYTHLTLPTNREV